MQCVIWLGTMGSTGNHLRGFVLLAVGLVLMPALGRSQTPPIKKMAVLPVVVPDVQGKQLSEASGILERLGLRAQQARRVESDTPAGTVVQEEPQPKSHVARGSAVQLDVSTGRAAPASRMPDLFGMTQDSANAALRRFEIRVVPSGTTPSPQPAGTIVTQVPAPNAELPPDRIARVTLAAALPPRRVVPKVIGMQLTIAVQILSRAGLTTGQVTYRSDASPAEMVLDQDPPPGQDADPRMPVNLTLSDGKPAKTASKPVIVPDLRGRTLETGRAILAKARLSLGEVDQALDPTPQGLIFDQSSPPGARVEAGTRVNIRVSTGGIYVPDVTGRTQDLATKAVSESRLRLGDVRNTESAEPAGYVIGQNPPGGTLVGLDTAISLVVSTGPPGPATILVPNVVGMLEQDARTALAAAGLSAGPITTQASSQVDGTVIDQDPAGGSQVVSGKGIQLFVSRSLPPPQPIIVPDLSGLTLGKARDILAAVGLGYSVAPSAGSTDDEAVITRQTPLPYERVQPHTVVQLGLESSFSLWTYPLWIAGGGFLAIVVVAAYKLGHKNGKTRPDPSDPVMRLSLVLRRNWGSPRIAMKIGNATDLALQFTAHRNPGRQSIRFSTSNSPGE